ncbi:MAG: hypothetical protein ABL957_09450 [Parvularculaceae bacterium]
MVMGSKRQAIKIAAVRGALRVGAAIATVLGAAYAQPLPPPDLPPIVNNGRAWKIVKETWTPADEKGFEDFVQAIGRSNCISLEGCLQTPANPYRHSDEETYSGDCADMAFILRAYYAWKNGLPFSYQNAMRTADGVPEDLRYSPNGNVVAGRRDAASKEPIKGDDFIGRIGGEVSTAMFRTHPETGGGKLYDDFYAIEISRESVRPGVLAYDIYGHVGIVYDVMEDGRVLVIASHPDLTVTRSDYGPNFLRAKPELGGSLKAWRPVRLEGAHRRADGSFAGGKVVGVPNAELADYSLEQFFGNVPHPQGDWRYGEFKFQDRTLGYYDYVRRKLADPGFRYDPVDELRHGMQTLCGAMKDRKVAIDRGVGLKVQLQPHPEKLPPNIYGTYGNWEDYSTPSRDARLKVSFIELRREMQRLVELVEKDDPSVAYEGTNLGRDLWNAFEEEKNKCTIGYSRSNETRVILNWGHVMDRLWEMSFDPYHCPERRWGAAGAELETCTDDENKTAWYKAQKYLRYQAERTYDVRMDFALHELKPPMVAKPEDGGLGVEAPADHDLRKYLLSLYSLETAGTDSPQVLPASAVADDPRPTFPEWHKAETYKIRNVTK